MMPGAIAYSWLGHACREALSSDGKAVRYGLPALGLLAAIAFLPRQLRRLRGGKQKWIDVGALTDRLRGGGITFADVRGPDEFDGTLGHTASALNLPLGELPDRLIEIRVSRDLPVILVCRTGKRLVSAATLLSDDGFRDISVCAAAWSNGIVMACPSTDDTRKNEARCISASRSTTNRKSRTMTKIQGWIASAGLAVALLPGWAWAQSSTDTDQYGWGPHMIGWGLGWYGMIFGSIFMVLLLALVIALAVLLVRWLGGSSLTLTSRQQPLRTPLDILKERFARGEIEKDEFEERRRALDE